ncbi:MAG: PQQ-binding-like beta-propeller repeat protein [Propionibacterium sp.]|nr:PQQ-binding-like beta-propeller repeat protein [Propionibacterium sp.]
MDTRTRRIAANTLAISASLAMLAACSTPIPDEPEPTPSVSASDVVAEPEPEHEPEPTVDVGYSELVEPTWTTGAYVTGRLVESDEAVLLYEIRDSELFLTALAEADGSELWSTRAGASFAMHPRLFTHDGAEHVAYLSPDREQLLSRPVLGGDATAIDGFTPNDLPFTCDDDVCVRGAFGDGEERRYRLVSPTELAVATIQGLPEHGRKLSDHVYSTNHRPHARHGIGGVEKLGFLVDGEVLWEHEYRRVFGWGFNSDLGTAWYDEEGEPLVGASRYWLTEEGERAIEDSYVTVALDPATGEVLWQAPGALVCAECSSSETTVVLQHLSGVAVRKDANGGLTHSPRSELAELRGLDPTTGEPIWQVTVIDGARPEDDDPVVQPEGRYTFFSGGSLNEVDHEGNVLAYPDEAVVACYESTEIELHGDETFNRPMHFYPCDVRGERVPTFSRKTVEDVGTAVGGHHVVVTSEGLSGFTS